MKNSEIDKTTKAEMKKQVEDLIMSDRNLNTDIEESAKKVQNSQEVAEDVVKEMEKIIKSNKCNILGLATR